MARNGSGSMSIVNTFVEETTISPDEVNQNFEDLGDEITNSLALDGQSSMTGQIKAAAGALATPGYSWANETGSGWYRAGAGDFRYAIGGADIVKITSSGFSILSGSLTATLADGSIATAKLADAAVTNAKLANMTANTLKANLSDSAGVPTDKTLTEILDDLAGNAQGSILYRSGTAWTALSPGTSGQFLKTQGAAANPAWGDVASGPSLATAQATTSGTAVDFTGISSSAKRILVALNGVSLSGTASLLVQLGAGSVATSGYSSAGMAVAGGGTGNIATSTAGFIVNVANVSRVVHGVMTLVKVSGDTWLASFAGADTGVTAGYTGGGTVTLSGTLDRLRLTTTNGTDTFDAGSVTILVD